MTWGGNPEQKGRFETHELNSLAALNALVTKVDFYIEKTVGKVKKSWQGIQASSKCSIHIHANVQTALVCNVDKVIEKTREYILVYPRVPLDS